ncbi:general substrate transporter [Anaeromyces robustus]|uniref:General substrate transporter n=1 Tax=Anaeromyces robustus TaxID=1754192 RepID=A0A1Y1WZ11_9FUNG|nr:general substrate transporter [Anaeromyces robustus]|eukprot:ORX78809.1 general substrate transporter [Anaeromyces robustus]
MGVIRDHINKHLITYTFICCIGAAIFGWEVGMLNILYSMKASFGKRFGMYNYNPTTKQWDDAEDKNIREMFITPSFTVGSLIGTIIVYFIIDRIGRSKSLCVSSVIYFLGVIVQITFGTVVTLCLGRFVSGIGAGIATTISPLYIAEISPKEIRGTLGVLNSLGLQLGKLFACLYETLCLKLITNNPTAQWRTAISGLAIPTVIFLLIVWFLPETPRFLLMKNRDDEALDILSKLREKSRNDSSVANEFSDMSVKLKADMSRGVMTWKEALSDKSIVYRLFIIIVLQLLRMLVGVAAIAYFSTQIYSKYLNIPTKTYGAWLATLNALINLIFSLPVVKYIERFGRRRTLLWSSCILGISMVLTFVLCYAVDKTKNMVYGWLCVIVMYIYTITNCSGWDSSIPVWQAEVFPISMRAKANSVGWFFKYIGSILVTSTSTTLMKYLGYYTFWVYAAFCLIAFVFIFFTVRETRGLTLEETEKLYRNDEKSPVTYRNDDIKIKNDNEEKTERDITSA